MGMRGPPRPAERYRGFQIFNPVLQGQKFDPRGDYVRRWVPELTGLAPAWIHKPWEAPAEVLSDAGIKLGQTYPMPIVEHGWARDRALKALETVRKTTAQPRKSGHTLQDKP
jgi:deoxyribodipyrimidine photo-lyase